MVGESLKEAEDKINQVQGVQQKTQHSLVWKQLLLSLTKSLRDQRYLHHYSGSFERKQETLTQKASPKIVRIREEVDAYTYLNAVMENFFSSLISHQHFVNVSSDISEHLGLKDCSLF
jgi:hypothetical protein